jgi:arylsulfatase A-like enzyme
MNKLIPLLLFLVCTLVPLFPAYGAELPNILYIMADDHTTQAIGAYGSRLAELNPTPRIDALANNGVRFDRVFCNNSICTPSRASIITGQYSQTNGVLDLTGRLPPQRQYLPMEMSRAGYQTAMIGKWHLKEEHLMVKRAVNAGLGRAVPECPLSCVRTPDRSWWLRQA